MGILSTVFDLICSFFSTCQGYLVSVWEVFFFNTRVLYSSDTVMMATPLLFVLLVAWRIFGPDDQTNSIAMQGYEANEPHTLVNDRTYAGGGNYSGHTRTGAADQTTSTNKKDDWCSSRVVWDVRQIIKRQVYSFPVYWAVNVSRQKYRDQFSTMDDSILCNLHLLFFCNLSTWHVTNPVRSVCCAATNCSCANVCVCVCQSTRTCIPKRQQEFLHKQNIEGA